MIKGIIFAICFILFIAICTMTAFMRDHKHKYDYYIHTNYEPVEPLKEMLFLGAKFGDCYMTRDGRKAIFTRESNGSFWLAVENTSFTWEYDEHGLLKSRINEGFDIIRKA